MPSEYELLAMWEEFLLAEGRSRVTITKYRYGLRRFASELRPPKPLTEATEQDVVVFLASFDKRASARTMYMNGMRSFYRWAAERGHIPTDPTSHIHPKAPTERPADAFTPEEVGALMAKAREIPGVGERNALAIQLAYSLGLRRSEVCGITPDDIDWAGGRVHIRSAIAKNAKERWIEMNGIAREALEGLRPWNNGTVLGSVSPQWFTMMVQRTAKRAGFPPGRRNAHLLRSAFATTLLAEGVPISVVSRLLGHTKVSTTSRYLAVRAVDRQEAVARLVAPS